MSLEDQRLMQSHCTAGAALHTMTRGRKWHKKIILYKVLDDITSAPQKVPRGSLERPTERVSILLGMDWADIMPISGDTPAHHDD